MAAFPKALLTNAGKNMIALAQLGQQLIFTKAQYGDGTIAEGEDQETFLKLKQAKLDLAIQSMKNPGTGQIEVTVLVDRTDLSQGFFGREIGLFAKIGETGTEQLFCYTNAGNLADYIPSKDDDDTPYHEFIDIEAVVGNSTTLTVVMDDTKIYVTKEDLDNHNAEITAHENLLKQYVKLKDFRQLFSSSGWVQLPNGLIFQWLGVSTDVNGYAQAVFPVAFPNTVLASFASERFADSWYKDSSKWCVVWGTDFCGTNKTSVRVRNRRVDNGGNVYAQANGGIVYAIGF